MFKIAGFEVVVRDDMTGTDIVLVRGAPAMEVSKDDEIAALRTALAESNRRAQIAENQLNDVVMAASIKLATARMVLSQIQDKSGQIGAAIQGVLDALPKQNTLPSSNRKLLK